MSFKIEDLWEVPKHKPSENPLALAPLFPFLLKLFELNDPSIKESKVWLLYTVNIWDDVGASSYINTHFSDWDYKSSVFKPCKAKRLNDLPIWLSALDVNLHFFFKREVPDYILGLVRQEYSANPIPYYDEPPRNHNMKYRLSSSGLRMEFYLEVI